MNQGLGQEIQNQNLENKTQKKFYKIETDKLFLVPYLKEFVPIYHQWMQDKEILYLTGSEPLSLQEEYENHTSWLFDLGKYTFIIFYKNQDIEKQHDSFPDYAKHGIQAGDINLFFHEYIEANEAEIDVMIGEPSLRKLGIAKESVNIMMDFGRAYYNKDTFIAKIKKENQPSIQLFKQLEFELTREIQAFGELNFEKKFSQKLSIEEFSQKYKISEVDLNE